MPKIIVSEPKTGKAYNIELDDKKARTVIGLKIKDVFDGSTIGLKGYKLEITGGSDKDGFPMRSDVYGGVRTRIILSKGPGYKPKENGLKRRKMVRGNVITPEIIQINAKIVKKGQKSIEKLIGKPEEKET